MVSQLFVRFVGSAVMGWHHTRPQGVDQDIAVQKIGKYGSRIFTSHLELLLELL